MMYKSFTARKIRLSLIWTLIVSMLVGLVPAASVSAKDMPISAKDMLAARLEDLAAQLAAPSSGMQDIKGHWAQRAIEEWTSLGLIAGYGDGTFRPDDAISRVEFVALANRVFAFAAAAGGDVPFSDVPADAWFTPQVRAATNAGYIGGYEDGTFRPQRQLLRVEAASMLARLVPVLGREGDDRLGAFTDHERVPDYGYDALNAVLASGYIQGFPDRTVRPLQPITRAEAVAILDRLLKQSAEGAAGRIVPGAKLLEEAGTYGPASGSFAVAGSVTVQAPGTVLRNVTIAGDLVIGASVGDGDVYLDGVTVRGRTFVNGGGENSVHVDDSKLGTVVIDKQDGRVRVVVGGTTVIERMDVQSGTRIESNGDASSIEGISITASGEVVLSGAFRSVILQGDATLTVRSGSIDNLQVEEGMTASTITLEDGVRVSSMELRGQADVKGPGIIDNALVDAPGVTFETKPANVQATERGELPGGSQPPIIVGPGPTTPTGPVTIDVGLTVASAQTTGVRIVLDRAVPGLAAVDFTIRGAAGQDVAVAFAGSLDGGTTYALSAVLTEVGAYTVTAAKTGYRFGAPVEFSIAPVPPADITVSVAVYDIGTAGFAVSLSVPVDGLTAGDFALTHDGDGVPIASAASGDGGATYAVSATLAEKETYALAIGKSGYDFGDPVAVHVPGVVDPGDVSVVASVYDIGTTGFAVSLSTPVDGLTADDFALTLDGDDVPIASAVSSDGGATYEVSAALAENETYRLAIAKAGYNFGAALRVYIPGSGGGTGDVVVQPAMSRLSSAGFVLSLDKPVPELGMDSFVITDSDLERVDVDMLADVASSREFEVYAALGVGKTYSLSLNKTGYAFNEPVTFTVAAVEAASSVGWVAFTGFSLLLDRNVSNWTISQAELAAEDGTPVAVQSVQLGANGKSAVFSAPLTAGATYRYRLVVSDYLFEGVVTVPETIPVARYTTFESTDGIDTGLRVTFTMPVPGLTADAFRLTHNDGTPYTLNSVTTADGSSYLLAPDQMTYNDYVLDIVYPGYDFGGTKKLVRTTVNPWYVPDVYPGFFAGFNPSVPGIAEDSFHITDASGAAVPVKSVTSEQGGFVVRYDGIRGQTFRIEIAKDGYDFGAPRSNTAAYMNKIVDPSYEGFTLTLNPPVAVDQATGFRLNRVNAGGVLGAEVPIRAATTSDGGYSYRIAADLGPGWYMLTVNAPIEQDKYDFIVPTVATISVDRVLNTGVGVDLDYPVAGLGASDFRLVEAGSGAGVWVQAATTNDGGSTYWLQADLPGGDYILGLNGHRPMEGVPFQVENTLDAGLFTVDGLAAGGFNLTLDNAVPGLVPSDLDLRDEQNNRLGGISLSTSDGGRTYRVNVTLAGNKDYTLSLGKDFVKFGPSVAFHVPIFVTAQVAEADQNGWVEARLTPALPQAQSGGIALKDTGGSLHYPAEYAMYGGGASYRFRIAGLSPLETYAVALNPAANPELGEFRLSETAFGIPPAILSAAATGAGVTVAFASPVDELTKSNFIIRTAEGTAIPVTAADTADGGSSYVLTANLVAGRFYSVQYQPSAAYQTTEPFDFAAQKLLVPTIRNVTSTGFKLQFAEKVAGLTLSQLVIRDPNGTEIGHQHFALSTADQGMSYQVNYLLGSVIEPGAGYTLSFTRDEFALAAPVSFAIPIPVSVSLVNTTSTALLIQTGSYSWPAPELENISFDLRDGMGKPVAAAATDEGNGTYKLSGSFSTTETYTLTLASPGYEFGAPLAIGLQIAVGIEAMFPTQNGFKLYLSTAIPNLSASEITITDNDGNAIAAQSVVMTDNGILYQVSAALSAGKTYAVSIARAGYKIKYSLPFSLNKRSAILDRISRDGFVLTFDKVQLLSSAIKIAVLNDQGEEQKIRGLVSRDGGLSYNFTVSLVPDASYTVVIDSPGDDFGAALPLLVRAVTASFGGMAAGSSKTFGLSLFPSVPNLRVDNFELRRASDGIRVPVLTAESADEGMTYTLSADFYETENYTILPKADGYSFGDPIAFAVPILVTTAIVRAAPNEFELGLNPPQPSLTADDILLKDGSGNRIAITSLSTEDDGATYRIGAAFSGGATYEVVLSKPGYDLGEPLALDIPSAIAANLVSRSEAGLTVALAPAVTGLDAGRFSLQASNGQEVQISQAVTGNGGATYALAADLEGGASYTLSVSLAGYDFGAPLVADIPIPVAAVYSGFTASGLTIRLDREVPGLDADDVSLLDPNGASVAVAAVATADGGATYTVNAALQENLRYSLRLAKAGYDFGADAAFLVPVAVAKSVGVLLTTGFAIKLNKAVNGLTASNLSLKDADGAQVAITSWTAADDGLSYEIVADLSAHAAYSLQLAADGYDFGPALELEALPPIILTANNVGEHSFNVTLSEPIPNLDANLVDLSDADGVRIPLNASTFFDVSGAAREGREYTINASLATGVPYILTIEDPDHPTSGPLEVIVPYAATAQATNVSASGFTLSFSRTVEGLAKEDVTLRADDGSAVAIDGIVAGETETSYTIVAKLMEGRTYSVEIGKKGYDFGQSANLSVQVLLGVVATVRNANETGFTIVLSRPVPELGVSLYKDSPARAYYDTALTTPDEGRTYFVGVSWPSDTPLTLALSKPGYDLGANQIVQYEKKKPQMLHAETSTDGTSMLLTFDSRMISSAENAGFAVKINSSWQSRVRTQFVNATTFRLLWDGAAVRESDTVAVAYAGVNAVRAENGAYLAQFGEVPVVNAASELGLVQSYAAKHDPVGIATLLQAEFGRTALEAGQLMREGGFPAGQYSAAIEFKYRLSLEEVVQLLFDMGLDSTAALQAIRGIGLPDYPYEWTGAFLSAGYPADEVAATLRNVGYQTKAILISFKQFDVSAEEAALTLRGEFRETSGGAAAQLKTLYDAEDLLRAVQAAYQLTNGAAVKAMYDGGVPASDAFAAIAGVYGAAALAAVDLLRQAGYSAQVIGAAIRQGSGFADVAAAVQALLGAGLSAQETYVVARGAYSQGEAASAMLEAGLSAFVVAGAVRSAGDAMRFAVAALRQQGNDDEAAARIAMSAWGTSLGLPAVAIELVAGGMSKPSAASQLRAVYGADTAAAYTAMKPMSNSYDPGDVFAILLQGGYEPARVAEYFLKHVYRASGPVFGLLSWNGNYPLVEALGYIHDAVTADGSAYPMRNAVSDVFEYGRVKYDVAETLAALRAAYEDDANEEPSLANLLAAISSDNLYLYTFYNVSAALIKEFGLTMPAWIDFRTANCPCDAGKVASDAKFLFAGKSSASDIVIALSASGKFTLQEVINGTVGLFPGDSQQARMWALTSVLRNTGYPVADIAASYDAEGLDWVRAFSQYGIAAQETADYLKNKGLPEDTVIARLEPYPLMDIALVLRELYGHTDAETIDALVAANVYHPQDIGWAVASAYGGNPFSLWVKTLKAQEATASSVVNFLSSRYPEFADAGLAGTALLQGGYPLEEIMQTLIQRSSNANLQNTIAVLKALNSQNQVTLAQLLEASSSTTATSGIEFLKNAKYTMFEIAGALKSYYRLNSGEAAAALSDKYPSELPQVLQIVAGVYSQNKEETAAQALAAEGITTLAAAVAYLQDAGFGLREIALVARNRLGASIGETAQQLSSGSGDDGLNVLLYTVAGAYGETVGHAIHELLAQRGQTSFAQAIAFVYERQRFDLLTAAKLAKEEYGLASGDALNALRAFGMYTDKDILNTISIVYSVTQNQSVVDSLAAGGFSTLADSVSYLLRMGFDPQSIVQVGKEHFRLDQVQIAAQLEASGFYQGDSSEIVAAISYVFAQTMNEALLSAMAATDKATFGEALPQLHELNITLNELVLGARDYYHLTSGETLRALLAKSWYSIEDVASAVLDYYGKPFAESVDDLLRKSGVVTIQEAAPMLRRLGYSLQEVVTAAKEHYGLSAEQAAEALAAMDFDSEQVIGLAVSGVYGRSTETNASAVLESAGNPADPATAAVLLKEAGFPIADVADALSRIYGQAPAQLASTLAGTGLFDTQTILFTLTTGADRSIDSNIVVILDRLGIASASGAADALRQAGYGLEDIAKALKDGYGQTLEQAKALLESMGGYASSAIESAVIAAYRKNASAADSVSYVLDLYGVTTAREAVSLISRTGGSAEDAAMQLKNRYKLDSVQAGELIRAFYPAGDDTVAIASVYYADTNLSILTQILPTGYATRPINAAGYLSGKLPLTDIALAMKLLFGLDALQAVDAMVNVNATPQRIYDTVAEVYGSDPLYAKLARMRDEGGQAEHLAQEMYLAGRLTNNDVYLVDTLDALGYDDATILKVRYDYFSESRNNAGTLEEQAALLTRFGLNTPESIMNFLVNRGYGVGGSGTLPVMRVIRAGLPQEPIENIALTLSARGFHYQAIEDAIKAMGEPVESISGHLKTLGYSAYAAAGFVKGISQVVGDQLGILRGNGYALVDYLRYVQFNQDAVSALREAGLSASDIAVAAVQSRAETNYANLATYLQQGGFTELKVIVGAIVDAGIPIMWIPEYLSHMASLMEIARAMADSGTIPLSLIVIGLTRRATDKLVYDIINEVGTREQKDLSDSLSYVERIALGDDEIKAIVTLGALREAGFSAGRSAKLLSAKEGDWKMAAVLLLITGYDWDDVLGAIWDAYRDAIGVMILQSMVGSTIANFMQDFQKYWKLGKIVQKIVKKAMD